MSLTTLEFETLLADTGKHIVGDISWQEDEDHSPSVEFRVLTNILATFAELEKETIRTRLVDGRRRADREGRRYAFGAPVRAYGWRGRSNPHQGP